MILQFVAAVDRRSSCNIPCGIILHSVVIWQQYHMLICIIVTVYDGMLEYRMLWFVLLDHVLEYYNVFYHAVTYFCFMLYYAMSECSRVCSIAFLKCVILYYTKL